MASDSLWFVYSLNTHQWAITIMHTLFIFVNFYGLYEWSKQSLIKKEANNVKIQ